MHKIYNIIAGEKNKKLQEKAALDATFQEVKEGWYSIGYLIIIKKLLL